MMMQPDQVRNGAAARTRTTTEPVRDKLPSLRLYSQTHLFASFFLPFEFTTLSSRIHKSTLSNSMHLKSRQFTTLFPVYNRSGWYGDSVACYPSEVLIIVILTASDIHVHRITLLAEVCAPAGRMLETLDE